MACCLAIVEPVAASAESSAVARLRLSTAGQVPPLLCRAGSAVELVPAGDHLPLGILPESHYEDLVESLQPGDVVLFASDGLPEAPRDGELFGFTRLASSAAHWSARGRDAESVAAGIWSDLAAWCGEDSRHDDMTLLVLRVPTIT